MKRRDSLKGATNFNNTVIEDVDVEVAKYKPMTIPGLVIMLLKHTPTGVYVTGSDGDESRLKVWLMVSLRKAVRGHNLRAA